MGHYRHAEYCALLSVLFLGVLALQMSLRKNHYTREMESMVTYHILYSGYFSGDKIFVDARICSDLW